MTKDKRLARYLKLRARAFATNNYRESDMAWMDLGDGKLEVVIGPYEVYEDGLFGYKAAFEAFICVRDKKYSERLQKIAKYKTDMEKALPIEDKYKNFKRGSTLPITVVEEMFTTSSRMRLCVKVMRKGRLYARETVLNDIVINKNALARLASIHTSINDHHLTTFKADGLIVATPTGSTAYSLAAGGPVIHPAVPGILLSPICPFTLTNRPLIISDTDRISIRLDSSASDIMVTFDGQIGMEITAEDEISVHKSLHPVRMIDIPGQNYFDVLKAKLRWSGGRV